MPEAVGDGGVWDHGGGGQERVWTEPGGGGEDVEGVGEGEEGAPHHHFLHLLRSARRAKVSLGVGGREGGREREDVCEGKEERGRGEVRLRWLY